MFIHLSQRFVGQVDCAYFPPSLFKGGFFIDCACCGRMRRRRGRSRHQPLGQQKTAIRRFCIIIVCTRKCVARAQLWPAGDTHRCRGASALTCFLVHNHFVICVFEIHIRGDIHFVSTTI